MTLNYFKGTALLLAYEESCGIQNVKNRTKEELELMWRKLPRVGKAEFYRTANELRTEAGLALLNIKVAIGAAPGSRMPSLVNPERRLQLK